MEGFPAWSLGRYLSASRWLGGWAGWLTYKTSPSYARRLRQNLFNALGREDEAVLRAAIVEAGRQALELPFIWGRPAAEVVASAVRTEGWELVEAARAEGAGILFITPHLGCFEITAQCIAAKIPITVLYRPPRKEVLQPLMEAGRAHGLEPIGVEAQRVLRLEKGHVIEFFNGALMVPTPAHVPEPAQKGEGAGDTLAGLVPDAAPEAPAAEAGPAATPEASSATPPAPTDPPSPA